MKKTHTEASCEGGERVPMIISFFGKKTGSKLWRRAQRKQGSKM